ncbi:CPBP family intramembrane glutamic endopeptidase [Leucobacter sp. W1153]|uniref:CPBP family intramembrane glutamic endopeptidase n=1 Tax=Leucobacter sp. W1153 TaxID=3439064 RepID=UPI003F36C646
MREGDVGVIHSGSREPHPDTDIRVRADRLVRVPWREVTVFVAIAMALAWLVVSPIWLLGGTAAPELGLLIQLLGIPMMFTPAIATLVVLFVMKVPRAERLRFLGMWPLRPAKRVVWFMVAAVFAPPVLVAAVVFVSAALGWLPLDLIGFSGFTAMLEAQMASLDPEVLDALPPVSLLVAIQILTIPLGALLNSVFAFGEEIGWRGWLLPALLPLGTWPALLISGVIWGLWHSPLILLGYNFGFTDWRGVVLMTGGCVAWGVVFGWARLRSGSVWPAVIGHGALNAAAGLGLLLVAAGHEPQMWLAGPLGIVAWAVITLVVVALALTGQFGRQPELAPKRVQATIPTAPTKPQRPELREH